MWATEKDFGKFMMNKLKKDGLVPIRIESASTISGMPDLYVEGAGDDYFIEFKNCRQADVTSDYWKIPWRPGQQGWAQKYNINHTRNIHNVYTRRKYTWTFVGLSNGVLLIRMCDYNENNRIYCEDANVFKFTNEQFKTVNIRLFLKMYTYTIVPYLYDNETWFSYITRMMRYYIEELFGSQFYDVDQPCVEDIIDDIPLLDADDLSISIKSLNPNEDYCLRLCNYVSRLAWKAYAGYLNNEVIHK